MWVLGESPAWCFCSGGGRSERVKGAIFASKGAALASISVPAGDSAGAGGGGRGTGFLIHRHLLLTTHATIPSASVAEAAEIRLCHGRLTGKLVPSRFFITSSVLDLSIVGLDTVEGDSTPQGHQPHYLRTSCNPSLDLGSEIYILGHTDKRELMIGEGKVVIATDNLIKVSTDGVTWCPGSAGFDDHGNLAFMVCDPMKLASSPTARSSSPSSSSSASWKRDFPMQFGIPIPIICDWLHQHWEGSLDEVIKPKLPLVRLLSSGQKSEHSSASFTLRRVFKAAESESDDVSSSSQIASIPKYQPRSSSSASAKLSQEENTLVVHRSSHEQGIPSPEIYESPRLTSGPARNKEHAPVQLLDINFPPRVPKSIALPLPLKQLLSNDNNVVEHKPGKPARENGHASWDMPSDNKVPTSGPYQEDCCSEVQSCSSPVDISVLQNEGDGDSSGEETMYSAETMESRNFPSPEEDNPQQVGRSQSCVNYSRWKTAQRNTAARKGALQKQHTLIPTRKTQPQVYSPTVSSSMKKRNSSEQPMRPRQSVVQASPRWMF